MAVISLFLASFAGNVHVRHSRAHSGEILVKKYGIGLKRYEIFQYKILSNDCSYKVSYNQLTTFII